MRQTNSFLLPPSLMQELKNAAQIKFKVDNVGSDVDGHRQNLGSKLQCANKMHCEVTILEIYNKIGYKQSGLNICSKINKDVCQKWFYNDVICM